MGSGAISWASKKQPIVSQSIVEVEYIVENVTTYQAISLRRILIVLMTGKRMEPQFIVTTFLQLHCPRIQSSMGEENILRSDITSSESCWRMGI